MRKLFGSYTYTWWQMGVFKLSLLAIGLIGGAYLAELVFQWFPLLIVIAVLASGYIIAVSVSAKSGRD